MSEPRSVSEDKRLGTESAYPTVEQRRSDGELITYAQDGLTKRELFAAMIAGDLAASYAQGGDFMESHVAKGAVKVADALLKELARG